MESHVSHLPQTSEIPSAPRRRLHDRLAEHETQQPRHAQRADVSNLLLLIDDDLRETALAMSSIDGFLCEALRLLDGDDMDPAQLLRLCANDQVMERMDTLGETLAMLRRRFGALAATIR